MSHFISKSSDRCCNFFNVLKDQSNFEWTVDCESTFNKLKDYLGSPPLLLKPKEEDILQLYLSVLESHVCSVLVQSEGSDQNPIFYVSKVL